MYYFAKILEAVGLGIILIGFIAGFPNVMSPRFFISGLILFGIGWAILKLGIKKR